MKKASFPTNSKTSPAPIGKGQNYGIQVLHDGGTEAGVDIVFVHGLTGNAYDTWLHKETGIHWPSELLRQDIPDTRILSFGYDADIVNFWNPASNSRLSSHAENLVGELVRERERTDTETRKILFVAHSLGGLVTEYALSHSRHAAEKHLHQIERCTARIAFLGVPHHGADLASWGKFGTRMVGVLRRANKDIVGVLDPGAEMLREVQKGFHTMLRLRKDEGSDISITCFYEELPVGAVGEIVPLHSAEISGYSCYGIHANHMDMTKFPDRKDRGYSALLGELLRWKKPAYRVAMNDHRSGTGESFWLDGRSVATAEQEILDIGRQCGIAEPSSTTVKSWLACKSQRWLLIINNADNRHIDYSEYMPSSKNGDILLTTRNPESTAYQTVGSERLGGLDPELALEILLKATFTPEIQWKEKEEAAVAIVKILGSHTLAIVQAGAFVRKKLCSLEEYSTLFRQQKEELLKFHSEANVSTYGNVYATFEVSAEYLQNSALPECVDALNFLHTLAFMHNNKVSVVLFRRASDYASELKNTKSTDDEHPLYLSAGQIARVPGYVQCGWRSNAQDRLRWRKACVVLETLSLIAIREDNSSIDISTHSLIHAWAKERQDYQSECIAWQSAATILALSCEGELDFGPFLIYLQSHVRACAAHQIENYTSSLSDMEAAQILFQFANVLYRTRNDASLSALVQHARSRLQDSHGLDQEIREWLDVFTARVHYHDGNYREAVCKFREVLESRAQRLAEDHPDRLDSQHELAGAYRANGQIKKAIDLLEYVINVERKLAEDHPDRLASQHELARAYLENGQIEKAVDLLELVVKIREDNLPEDHPDRLTSQHELAQQKLAEDLPHRLASQYTLAICYEELGRFDEAIKLLEHVVKIREQKLAEDDPSRLTSQHYLANCYKETGRFDEAIKLLGHVVHIEEKLAVDDPDRLASQRTLVMCYEEVELFDEAIQLLEHMVRIEEKLAEDDPDRLTSQYTLADCYRETGRFDEAIQLLEHVVHIEEKLAEDDPDRLASQRALSRVYRAKERKLRRDTEDSVALIGAELNAGQGVDANRSREKTMSCVDLVRERLL